MVPDERAGPHLLPRGLVVAPLRLQSASDLDECGHAKRRVRASSAHAEATENVAVVRLPPPRPWTQRRPPPSAPAAPVRRASAPSAPGSGGLPLRRPPAGGPPAPRAPPQTPWWPRCDGAKREGRGPNQRECPDAAHRARREPFTYWAARSSSQLLVDAMASSKVPRPSLLNHELRRCSSGVLADSVLHETSTQWTHSPGPAASFSARLLGRSQRRPRPRPSGG